GVIHCSYEEDELKVDKMAPKYERLGNGVECPEKVELILEKCKEMGTTNDTNGRLLWDVLDSFKYIGYQKPIIRDVIMESPSISNYEKVNNYCKLANNTMLTYCAILNSKVIESKKLRDRVLGYLTNAASQTKVNLGEALCIMKKFWEDVLNMHEDKDGFRESTRERISTFPSIVTRAEEHFGVKADDKCELGEKYPDTKYKSITVSLVKEELSVDKMTPKYKRLGNGVECPEKVELIMEKCKDLGSTNDTNGKL
ncbi:unnamed protein product, partial [Medioppia subpectinata]